MNQLRETISLEKEAPDTAKKISRGPGVGVIATGVIVTAAVGIHAIAGPFVTPAFRRICLPFIPATDQQSKNVFKLLKGRKGTLVDLGSGDGRLVLEAARRGFHSTGYELNLWLVYYSRLKARQLGLHNMAQFHRKDLWKTDLTTYDNVVIFGVASMMEPLQTKLADELKTDGHVVVSRTPFPDWMPTSDIDEKLDSAWLYDRTSIKSSGKQNMMIS